MTKPMMFNRKCSYCGKISKYNGLLKFCPECNHFYEDYIIRDYKHCTTKYCKGRPIFNSDGRISGYTE